MLSHINEFSALKNLETLNFLITGEKLELKEKKSQNTIISKKNKKNKKNQYTFETYSKNPEVICAIQNYNKFLNFLTFMRKQDQNVFMYIEGEENVVFVTSTSVFPIIIVKFPINLPYVYAKQTEMCFDIPLQIIYSPIKESDKKYQNQYQFLIKQIDDQLILSCISSSTKKEHGIKRMLTAEKKKMYSSFFYETKKIKQETIFSEDIGREIDYELELNSAQIYILWEATNCLNVNKEDKKYPIQKLIFKNGYINLYQSDNENISYDDQCILNCETNNCIYWDYNNFNEEELILAEFSSIFKNYKKITSETDFVYFCICDWREYTSTKAYLFIKIITPNDLSKEKIKNFGDLIKNNDRIFEIYLCYTIPKNN